jgi:hypothetical protein
MSYSITKSDGTQLVTILDGTTDQIHSSLTLIGKNASSYGSAYNENLVYLLENFSNTLPPRNPIKGQLWFDSSQGRLQVYDGTNWKVSGGTIVAGTPPSGYASGDIWIDSINGQLYFNDGSSSPNKLAGPIYNNKQGLSGFVTNTVLDTSGNSHTIVLLYVGQVLIGIFSNTSFTPSSPIAGFSGTVSNGFNVSSWPGINFNVPVSQASSLVAADGSLRTAQSFMSTTDSSATSGTITITNSTPLILGATANTQLNVDTNNFQILSNTPGQNFQITTRVGSTLSNSLFVSGTTGYVGINMPTSGSSVTPPSASLDVTGDVIITGNLTVNGTTETISSTIVTIADQNIILGATASPTDTTANGGGITLKGQTDKFIDWAATASSNATTNTGYWNFSDSINISTTGLSSSPYGYYLNNQLMIGYNSTNFALGPSITSASGLTSIGTLNQLGVANITITGSTISYYNVSNHDGTITLVPKGAGSVDVSGARITTVSTPQTSTDAATKGYVDGLVYGSAVVISLTTTGLTNSQIASTYLSKIFPANEHNNNTTCRAVCTDSGTTTIRQFVLTSGIWVYTSNL